MYKDIKIYNKHVAFWGSPLSNFYECSFEEKGIVWKSSEQCFMAKKAAYFDDFEIYDMILETETPKDAKKLGRQVRDFDSNKWLEVCFDEIWGVKMDWRNPDIDDECNWQGQNLLGKVLDKVREELKNHR